MINRRGLIKIAPTLGASGLLLTGCEKDNRVSNNSFESRMEFIGPEDSPEFRPEVTNTNVAVGTGSSRHSEVRAGFRLLWDAPRTTSHMDIATYFENINLKNQNERNAAGQIASYNEEWVGRANPLITSFFAMTNTMPTSGDQTAWCAAFVSFILYAAGKPNKFSALSGSYRSYSSPTLNPVYGDIVVFSKNGPLGKRGFGHVGFFVSQTETSVRVLGGNQRAGQGSTGAVVQSEYLKAGSSLSLHSFRAVPTL